MNLKLTPFSRVKWEQARALGKKGAFQDAEKELLEALEEEPNQPLLKCSLADLYLRQDKVLEAKLLAEEVLSLDPNFSRALFVLGETYSREGRLEEALQCFRQAAGSNPTPYVLVRIARTLREMKSYGEALESLDRVLVKEKENPMALKEKAVVLNRMERREEALAIYEKLRKLTPEDSFVRREIYRLKGIKRPQRKNIRELEKVLTIPSSKDEPHLHGLLAENLKKAGRLKEAAEEFHSAWQLSSGNLFYLKQEGFCLYRLGDYEGSIQALGQAFREDPADHFVKTTLKKMYSITKNLKGFISLLEEVLQDHPQNMKVLGTLKKVRKEANANQDFHGK